MPSPSFSKTLLLTALAVVALLLIPAIAMQFTSEANWGAGDFIAAGVILFSTGTAIAACLRYVRGTGRRVALVAAIVLGAALVWAELAVGVF